MNIGRPLPKKLLVHRNNRRLIAAASKKGGTFTVEYLDPVDGQPDTEEGVDPADVIKVVNSWDLARNGDWFMENQNSAAFPYRLWSKNRNVEQFADRVATFERASIASSARGGYLMFRSWDQMVAWSARKGIAPNGWTLDVSPTKAWVPVGDRRAATSTPAKPCKEGFAKCGRPVELDDEVGLCGRHAAAKRKRDENDARWRAEWEQARVQREEREHREQAAHDWVERLAGEFGVRTEALSDRHAGEVAVNPEGLYGLLVACQIELREMGIEVTELVPIELRHGRRAHGDEV